MSTAPGLDYLQTCTLRHGSHEGGDPAKHEHCAREALHYALTGELKDGSVCGVPNYRTSLLPAINDWLGWKDDADRTAFFRPWWRRIALTPPHSDPRSIAYRLADYAVRVVVAEGMDATGLPDEARRLRDLPPVTDRESAYAASDAAARASAGTAVLAAARAAVLAAARAAAGAALVTDTARAAAHVVSEVGTTRNRAAFLRHATALLEIVCGTDKETP